MDLNNQAGVDSANTIIDINYPPEEDSTIANVSVDSLKANNEESELVFEMLNDAKPSKFKSRVCLIPASKETIPPFKIIIKSLFSFFNFSTLW